jgi:hypothetical protein
VWRRDFGLIHGDNHAEDADGEARDEASNDEHGHVYAACLNSAAWDPQPPDDTVRLLKLTNSCDERTKLNRSLSTEPVSRPTCEKGTDWIGQRIPQGISCCNTHRMHLPQTQTQLHR